MEKQRGLMMGNEIAEEALECVMSYVNDPRDRSVVSQVCKQWYRIDALTRKHVTVAFCYTIRPADLTRRFKRLESLKLKGKPRAAMFNLIPEDWGAYARPWIQEISSSCLCLKSLHLRRIVVKDADLATLVRSHGHMLQVLKLEKCCGFSTLGLLEVARSCRLLLWENLCRRGWEGPSLCPLCRQDEENFYHLFVGCLFTSQIWSAICGFLQVQNAWIGTSIDTCYSHWITAYPNHLYMPAFIYWYLWKVRNLCIFEDYMPPLDLIVKWIMDLHTLYPVYKRRKKQRINLHPSVFDPGICGFFDGAANSGICGGGGSIRLNNQLKYLFHANFGRGTNMRAELLALWSLLQVASYLKLDNLLILGDSKVVIDWVDGKSDIRLYLYVDWCRRIKEVIHTFRLISFEHIMREFNTEADLLSKEGLKDVEGNITVTEIRGGQTYSNFVLPLY